MRNWIEKLANKIKQEGNSTGWNAEVLIPQFRINITECKNDKLLVVEQYEKDKEGNYRYISRSVIKIYEDEYDYLNTIIENLNKINRDKFIEIFNSFE
jgi:hypothetical protein